MSEVDATGKVIAGGGDDLAPRIGLVLLIATAACAVVALGWPHLPVAWSAIASSATWVLLFAWRASVSRTAGANLWIAGLVVVVIPAAGVAVALVLLLQALRTGRRTA